MAFTRDGRQWSVSERTSSLSLLAQNKPHKKMSKRRLRVYRDAMLTILVQRKTQHVSDARHAARRSVRHALCMAATMEASYKWIPAGQ